MLINALKWENNNNLLTHSPRSGNIKNLKKENEISEKKWKIKKCK
jgi:hypothetical protein